MASIDDCFRNKPPHLPPTLSNSSISIPPVPTTEPGDPTYHQTHQRLLGQCWKSYSNYFATYISVCPCLPTSYFLTPSYLSPFSSGSFLQRSLICCWWVINCACEFSDLRKGQPERRHEWAIQLQNLPGVPVWTQIHPGGGQSSLHPLLRPPVCQHLPGM